MTVSRQSESINTVTIAGAITGKIQRWVLSDGRDVCSFFVETYTVQMNDDGKLKERKNKILCRAYGSQAQVLQTAKEGTKIMIPNANIVGRFHKNKENPADDYYEQFVKVSEFTYYDKSPNKAA